MNKKIAQNLLPLPPSRTGAPLKGPARPAAPTSKNKSVLPPLPGQKSRNENSLSVPTSAPERSGDVSSSPVAKMQQALVNLGTVMSQNYLSKLETKNQPRGDSDPFGNFLVNQYINNEDVVGKQFVHAKNVHEPTRSNTAMENKGLRGVVDTIGVIGTPGHERAADGIWKTRTNNSLKQTAAVAASLVRLQADMNLNLSGYDNDDLKELYANVPDNYTELGNTANERAKILTNNINKLSAFYTNFEKAVLNNDKYRPLITQQKAFKTYGKGEELSKEENDFFETNKNQPIPNANFNGKPITLAAIYSPEAFKQFLLNNNLQGNKPAIYNKYLDEVKKAIETGYSNRLGF